MPPKARPPGGRDGGAAVPASGPPVCLRPGPAWDDVDEQVVRGVAKSAVLDVQISAGAGRAGR